MDAELEKKKEVTSITVAMDALKNINGEQLKPTADISFDLIKDVGNFFIALGDLQKKNEKTYSSLMNLSDNPQMLLSLIVSALPAEKVKKMVQLFLELSAISSKIADIKKMDADTQIELGKKLIELSSELKATGDTEENTEE